MEVSSITPRIQPHFTNIEETKRGEATRMVNNSTLIDNKVENVNLKDKFKYNWKTVSAVTGGVALVLLGVLNRRPIAKFFKNILKKNNLTPSGKKPYVPPKMDVMDVPGENVSSVQVVESFEPEFLFKGSKKKPSQTVKTINIDENGRVVKPKAEQSKGNYDNNFGFGFSSDPNRKVKYGPTDAVTDTVDTVADAVIINELLNSGGKGARTVFDNAKSVFESGKIADIPNPVIDDVAVEGSSGLFDTIGGIMDNVGEGLSDFAGSVGEALGEIV